jgi:hypothetical protein
VVERVISYLLLRQWSIENMLVLNTAKTQGMVLARIGVMDGAEPLTIDGDTIPFLNSIRKLGLYG